MPLGHWNWKLNQAPANYSTYDQDILAGMLVLSSQSCLLGTTPIVWLCDHEPEKNLSEGSSTERSENTMMVDLSQSVQVALSRVLAPGARMK